MILISNLNLSIKDGSTISPTEIYGVKTYIDIGSGNVFGLSWNTPTSTDDTIDRYSLIIKRYEPTLGTYHDIFNDNIGLTNEFYVDSAMLPNLTVPYMTSIYLVAYGKQGSVLTSNVVNPYISKGSGTYVKVQPDDYKQPIMKRAVALAKTKADRVALAALESGSLNIPSVMSTEETETIIRDCDGYILRDVTKKILFAVSPSPDIRELADITGQLLVDAEGKALLAEVSGLLENPDGWVIMQESYTKDDTDRWRINDIRYEVLIDKNGEIVYALNKVGTDYEPAYVL